MSTEKTIKAQSKRYLCGNWVTIISAILALCTVGILIETMFWIITIYFKIINVETGTVYDSRSLAYVLVLLSTVFAVLLLSPLINGIYKMIGNLVRGKPCEISDMCYFFGNIRRYLKTVIINMVLIILFMFFSKLTNVFEYTCYLLNADYYRDFGLNFTTLILFFAGAVTVVINILLYLIILNYPLIAYSFDDSKSAVKYIFGYLGVSFRNFGKTIKLVWSFIGLLLLCFFVAPAFYVVPYLLTSLANSAKWLFEIENKKYIGSGF